MELASITGIPALQPALATPAERTGALPFQDTLRKAFAELEELEAAKSADTLDLALGNIDDLGAMAVNSAKAEVAVQMVIEMRNKLVDAYSEIMRMNI